MPAIDGSLSVVRLFYFFIFVAGIVKDLLRMPPLFVNLAENRQRHDFIAAERLASLFLSKTSR